MTSAVHFPPSGLSAQLPRPNSQRDPRALSELIAARDIDVVPGDPPVPIAGWRVSGGHTDADALTLPMAALPIGFHTRPGDTVVPVGGDPALAGAAGAGGRTCLAVPDPDDLPVLDHAAGTVTLIMLPWPASGPPGWPGNGSSRCSAPAGS
jgi:hypothetical protein